MKPIIGTTKYSLNSPLYKLSERSLKAADTRRRNIAAEDTFYMFPEEKQKNIIRWIGRTLGIELAYKAEDDKITDLKNIKSSQALVHQIINEKERDIATYGPGKVEEEFNFSKANFQCLPYIVKELFKPNSELKFIISQKEFFHELDMGIKAATGYSTPKKNLHYVPDSEIAPTSSASTISPELISDEGTDKYFKIRQEISEFLSKLS